MDGDLALNRVIRQMTQNMRAWSKANNNSRQCRPCRPQLAGWRWECHLALVSLCEWLCWQLSLGALWGFCESTWVQDLELGIPPDFRWAPKENGIYAEQNRFMLFQSLKWLHEVYIILADFPLWHIFFSVLLISVLHHFLPCIFLWLDLER